MKIEVEVICIHKLHNSKRMDLFSLPDEILTTLLFTWLDLEGIARLDSGFCIKSKRPRFLSVLSAGHQAYDHGFCHLKETGKLSWNLCY